MISFAGLMPHPPIVVPAVGGARLAECRATFEACRTLAERLMATRPERLFLVSPHSPRRRDALGLWGGKRVAGDLGRFGAPQARVDFENDPVAVAAIQTAARDQGLSTWTIAPEPLDHGAVVPLTFLAEQGWSGPTTIASLPGYAEPSRLRTMGRAIGQALSSLPGSSAFIASGDMSHRVLPGAPAGFHPRALEFDRALTSLIEQKRLAEIASIDPELRELAAEDAADTTIMAAAATSEGGATAEVLSYEHPFGVGYLVAVIFQI